MPYLIFKYLILSFFPFFFFFLYLSVCFLQIPAKKHAKSKSESTVAENGNQWKLYYTMLPNLFCWECGRAEVTCISTLPAVKVFLSKTMRWGSNWHSHLRPLKGTMNTGRYLWQDRWNKAALNSLPKAEAARCMPTLCSQMLNTEGVLPETHAAQNTSLFHRKSQFLVLQAAR